MSLVHELRKRTTKRLVRQIRELPMSFFPLAFGRKSLSMNLEKEPLAPGLDPIILSFILMLTQ